MLLRRTTTIAVALTAVMIGAAACGGEDEPGPTAEPRTSESPTESTEPTTTAPAWEAKYKEQQIEAYEAALGRWKEYEARAEPIWSRGQATQAAAELFKEYFPSPVWQGEYGRLELYEANNVTVTGVPTVYWSRAKTISKAGKSVEILQCVDFSDVTTEQNGKPAKGNKWTTTPHLRALSLSKPVGHGWLVYAYGDPDGKKRSCEP